jgi:hypothetical protein
MRTVPPARATPRQPLPLSRNDTAVLTVPMTSAQAETTFLHSRNVIMENYNLQVVAFLQQ